MRQLLFCGVNWFIYKQYTFNNKIAQCCVCKDIDTVNVFAACASYRVTFAGLELEVVCFVKHWILLHKQLLVELLDYLKENTEGDQYGAFKFPAVKACQYWYPM